MYDAIVVGARCGGAPTAMLLARKGYKVLLVDKSTFPSDIPHGHYIHRSGPRRLARWGLLDRIRATDCPAVESITIDAGDFPLVGTNLVVDGIATGYGPRRSVLDAVLLDAALEAGVEWRQGFHVDECLFDGDRVVGIRGRALSGGPAIAERATITIGADGKRSRIARAVQAPMYDTFPVLACWYFGYWGDVTLSGLEIYARPDAVVFAFPTNGRLAAIFVGWPIQELQRVRRDIERAFSSAIDAVPSLSARVRSGRRASRYAGATDLDNFFRVPHGPGWALVGDAGCHKDPFLALGICDAFRDVDLLVDAIDAGLSGRSALGEALAEYERRRNDATRDDYWQNVNAARFLPMPEDQRRLRAALRGRERDTRQFFLAREEMIPRDSFFTADNLRRLLSAGTAQLAV